MLTLKHVEQDGHEGVMQALEVSFSPTAPAPSPRLLCAFGVPGPDAGARTNGTVMFSSGTVYVVNDSGKTVAIYNL